MSDEVLAPWHLRTARPTGSTYVSTMRFPIDHEIHGGQRNCVRLGLLHMARRISDGSFEPEDRRSLLSNAALW